MPREPEFGEYPGRHPVTPHGICAWHPRPNTLVSVSYGRVVVLLLVPNTRMQIFTSPARSRARTTLKPEKNSRISLKSRSNGQSANYIPEFYMQPAAHWMGKKHWTSKSSSCTENCYLRAARCVDSKAIFSERESQRIQEAELVKGNRSQRQAGYEASLVNTIKALIFVGLGSV